MSGCLFCKIIKKELPARIEHETEEILAFHDINPQAPAHLLIIPKKHIEKMSDLEEGDARLAGEILLQAKKIAAKNNWPDYRLVFNNGRGAQQTVFHIHMHLLAGRAMHWPPG